MFSSLRRQNEALRGTHLSPNLEGTTSGLSSRLVANIVLLSRTMLAGNITTPKLAVTPDTSPSSSLGPIPAATESGEDNNDFAKSTVIGASINFVNCIVGAGCIGFGGAMAASGGLLSIVTMIFCAWLMKLSFDLLISLGLQTPEGIRSSYESLGEAAYGSRGRAAVLVSKGIFCFGGLVAIVVIVKDNFGPSMRNLLGTAVSSGQDNWLISILLDDKISTIILSAVVILPLSCLRDMTPLERYSAVKIFSFMMILVIVVYLWATLPENNDPEVTSFFERWIEVRSG